MSYGDLMDNLSSAWRRTDAPKDPATDDGYWVHTLKTVLKCLKLLAFQSLSLNLSLRNVGIRLSPRIKLTLNPSDLMVVRERMLTSLFEIYSPADWETFIK